MNQEICVWLKNMYISNECDLMRQNLWESCFEFPWKPIMAEGLLSQESVTVCRPWKSMEQLDN